MLIDRLKGIAIASFLALFFGYSLFLFIGKNKAEKELAVAIEQRNKAVADAILLKRTADALLARIELMQSTYSENERKFLAVIQEQRELLNKYQQDCVKEMQKLKNALAKEQDNSRKAIAALKSSISQYEAMLSATTDELAAQKARADYAENLYALQRKEMQKALDLLGEIEYSLKEKENASGNSK